MSEPERNTSINQVIERHIEVGIASTYAAQVHTSCASVTAVYLPFFVFGRVLTRLD
jgi:hypothetical protein